MLLVSAGNRPLLLPIIIKAVIVVLLNSVLLIQLLRNIWCRLLEHDIDGIVKEMQHTIRERFITFLTDDFKGVSHVFEIR